MHNKTVTICPNCTTRNNIFMPAKGLKQGSKIKCGNDKCENIYDVPEWFLNKSSAAITIYKEGNDKLKHFDRRVLRDGSYYFSQLKTATRIEKKDYQFIQLTEIENTPFFEDRILFISLKDINSQRLVHCIIYKVTESKNIEEMSNTAISCKTGSIFEIKNQHLLFEITL
jgi:hypothetical protein